MRELTSNLPAGELPRQLAVMAGRMLRLLPILLIAGSVQGMTIELAGIGGAGGGFGNAVTFSSGGISLTARAFAETGDAEGAGFYRLETAEVYSWDTGIGICSRSEGLAHGGCDSSEHEMDTQGPDELLVLIFNQRVDFHDISVNPYDGPGRDANDRDIVYRVGDLSGWPELHTYTFDSLKDIAGLGGESLSAALASYSPFTHALTGTGNALFISGNYFDRGCIARQVGSDRGCEAYKISSISVSPAAARSVVPVPAAVWLLGSGLGLLGLLRRLQKRS